MGYEIDFVWITDEKKTDLAQVCLDINDQKTEERESRALSDAMDELNIKESWIVTLDLEKDIGVDDKTIHVIPAWKFLLR